MSSAAPLLHPSIVDGWFHERNDLWPGQAFSLQVSEILHVERSLYQDVLVFRSPHHGNILVLDGVIQCTERDEFSYQEMITHLPMMSHADPKRVLVIGGGDGGVLREVVKHAGVEEVTLCEIDEAVIRVSRQYLPQMAAGFDHPKVTLFVGDGFDFMAKHESHYDVIITDSSDPVGPAETLFRDEYFRLMHRTLRPGGIICSQGECQWLHLPIIKRVLNTTRAIYPRVAYAFTTIPSYPSGQIGFIVCQKEGGVEAVLGVPTREWSEAEEDTKCRYYNKNVHRAAFVLPQFTRLALKAE